MNLRKMIGSILGIVFYSIGILSGLLLLGAATSANLESTFYGFDKFTKRSLTTLKCPVFISRTETGVVTASVKNTTDKPIDPLFRVDVSNPILISTNRMNLSIDPGKTGQIHWIVTSKDLDLKYFAFVRMLMYPAYPLPAREGTCGIVVLNLPNFSGGDIFTILFIVCLAGLVVGKGLWEINNRPPTDRAENTSRAMTALAIIVLLGMFFSFQGWWGVGIVFSAIAVLMLGAIFYFVLNG